MHKEGGRQATLMREDWDFASQSNTSELNGVSSYTAARWSASDATLERLLSGLWQACMEGRGVLPRLSVSVASAASMVPKKPLIQASTASLSARTSTMLRGKERGTTGCNLRYRKDALLPAGHLHRHAIQFQSLNPQ